MKQSISYYLTLLVIKVKGVKKNFSQDPIDYEKVRKEDVRNPKDRLFKGMQIRKFKLQSTSVTELKIAETNQQLVVYIHGGAFISGPAQHHWDSLKTIVQQTNCTAAWMCDYPKAPEHKITEISRNIDEVYNSALAEYPAEKIILMGDSAGGTLIVALIQRLLVQQQQNNNIALLPKRIILISPVMDATMTNEKIAAVDKVDPMLSRKGVHSAKKMCVDTENLLTDPMISPINGSFMGFPPTDLFLAENDVTFPDQLLTAQKMKNAGVEAETIKGVNMPHIWPLLPVMSEAKVALNTIVDIVRKCEKHN